MNKLIDKARHIAVNDPVATVSVTPVMLDAPTRPQPIEMRITAPMDGDNLPIVLLSHGHGPSLYIPSKDGYGPLADFYAAHGFVVIQPTHGNSKVAGFDADAPGAPFFWRSRVEDFKLILDHLKDIEASIPALAGRLDPDRGGGGRTFTGRADGGYVAGRAFNRYQRPRCQGCQFDRAAHQGGCASGRTGEWRG